MVDIEKPNIIEFFTKVLAEYPSAENIKGAHHEWRPFRSLCPRKGVGLWSFAPSLRKMG